MKSSKQSIGRKILSSPVTLFIGVIILIFLIRAVFGISDKVSVSNEKLNQAIDTLNRQKERGEDLTAKVKSLETEEGVRTEIRTKYPAIKEGESVAVIIDNNESSTTQSTSTPELGFWQKIWHFLRD